MVSYCSLSNDRLLTKILIENSNKSLSKCSHRFVNTPQWVDGLDIWSTTQTKKNNFNSNKNLDFDEDIGLHLPRYQNLNRTLTKNDFIPLKPPNKDFIPQRLKQLINKEENIDSSNERIEHNQTIDHTEITNIDEKGSSNDNNSNKIRSPLRHVQSNIYYKQNKPKENNQSFNRENFQYLLKEELSNLLNRSTTNISSKRTLIKIPSVQIKHQNLQPKTNEQQQDPTSIIQRYSKLQHLLISPTPNQPTINNKLWDTRQSPLIFQGVSTFGLTVTPLDFSSTKNLQNSSSDKTFQQETISRPVTQPVALPSSITQNEEQQKILFKRNTDLSFNSPSLHFTLLNKNSHDQQKQSTKKPYRHYRSLSKTPIERAKPFHVLPHVAGKRITNYISNQTNS